MENFKSIFTQKSKILFLLSLLFIFAVQNKLAAQNEKQSHPKNIIIMIGDGMGVNQVYTSLLSDNSSAFRRFNSIGLSITCSADHLVTDSGAGVTAISTGYRTNNHFISVSPKNENLKNVFEYAKEKKMATGLVVTCSITHATPAGFVAHVSDRGEEDEIASQFLNSDIDVAIGGGRKFFNARKDGLNLLNKLSDKGYTVINNIDDLKKFNSNKKFYAMLEDEALKRAEQRDYSLADLTDAAIKSLSKHEQGFIMMVEGSQIDWGGHANNANYMTGELKDFNRAVNTVLNFAYNNKETLVIVTGDHETGGLSITGGELDGSKLNLSFDTTNHTANAVGIFAYGPGENEFRGVNNNYMIGRKLINFIDPKVIWK